MNVPKKISEALKNRKESGLFRSLDNYDSLIDFSSNDYLGLGKISRHADNLPQGSGGSRLISGNHPVFNACEIKLKEYFKAESALIFNSGYDANLGLISSIADRGDIILYDALIHASLIDGMLLSKAELHKFRHNDLQHLEELLNEYSKSGRTIYVITESVFSMDGDFCPLEKLIQLCEKNKAWIILDEAHAGGVIGAGGKGLACELGLQNKIFARIITFGKALGLHGACILGSEELKHFLVNFSRSFIFTTATSPASIAHLLQILNEDYIEERRLKLLENIHYFRQKSSKLNSMQSQEGPIQIFLCSGNNKVNKATIEAMKYGLFVKGIKYPTVPAGKERLRICLHSYNTHSDIDKLIEFLVGLECT